MTRSLLMAWEAVDEAVVEVLRDEVLEEALVAAEDLAEDSAEETGSEEDAGSAGDIEVVRIASDDAAALEDVAGADEAGDIEVVRGAAVDFPPPEAGNEEALLLDTSSEARGSKEKVVVGRALRAMGMVDTPTPFWFWTRVSLAWEG